jgi:urease accessory protein
MCADVSPFDQLQRAVGILKVSFRKNGAYSALRDLRQEGSLKVRFPMPETGELLQVVTLNTAGGITGGDTFQSSFLLEEGSAATITTQAPERIYRALPSSPPASVCHSVTLGPGAMAEWLPQETILFNGALLRRRLFVTLTTESRFLGVEAVVFGRTQRGEKVLSGFFSDTVHIVRDGVVLLHDAVHLSGPIAEILARPAVAKGGAAVATVWYVSPDAAASLEAVRAVLKEQDSGASAWNNMLIARLVAPEGAELRARLISLLQVLRKREKLPRVWMC